MSRSFRQLPFFLFLLPLYFIVNGYIRFYGSVPVWDAVILLLIYLLVTIIVCTLCWIYFRDFIRSAVITVLLISYYLFFGAGLDVWNYVFHGSFLNRYSVILSLSSLVFFFLFRFFKKTRLPLPRVVVFLNLFLCLLLLIDGIRLGRILLSKGHSAHSRIEHAGFVKCDSCSRPDIYLVLLDEYSGNKVLQDQFGIDNSLFTDSLVRAGFVVTPESRSNYNYTPYSMASILGMDYLDLDMKTKNPGNLNLAYQGIRESVAPAWLRENGYHFYNYSIFDFPGYPARGHDGFIPYSTKLINAQTLWGRLEEVIAFEKIYGRLQTERSRYRQLYQTRENNELFMGATLQTLHDNDSEPKFVYTHLMMPHYPYYYDSLGKPLPEDRIQKGKETDKTAYAGYLKYCNGRILSLVHELQSASAKPPVIILLGDHGFRHYDPPVTESSYFQNLQAVFIPGAKLDVYPGMSNVNLFRLLFNQQFKQRLPLLKDSTVYLWR
ncbi:MAG: sulfatase-like hydrolase/transferase [Chitinophagaceae bacterium]|nr:sulfatase-like hydrolase/transferase [Chitinophagaceae bacterium]